MPSPNITGLTFLLNKAFPSPTAEQVVSSHHYSVRLYMDFYSTNMLKNNSINGDMDRSENLPSNRQLRTHDWIVLRDYRLSSSANLLLQLATS